MLTATAANEPVPPSSYPRFGAEDYLQFDYRLKGFFNDSHHTVLWWKPTPNGGLQITKLYMQPRYDDQGAGPYHRGSLGDRTKPGLQGAIDAFQATLPGLLTSLGNANRHAPNNGFGNAGNTFCLFDVNRYRDRTNIFNGALDDRFDQQPAVKEAGTLLVGLMERFRHDTKADRHWPHT